MSGTKTIDCPRCGQPAIVGGENPYRPFCSRRCKLIDLGDWLDESNRIPDPPGSAAGVAPERDDHEGYPPH